MYQIASQHHREHEFVVRLSWGWIRRLNQANICYCIFVDLRFFLLLVLIIGNDGFIKSGNGGFGSFWIWSFVLFQREFFINELINGDSSFLFVTLVPFSSFSISTFFSSILSFLIFFYFLLSSNQPNIHLHNLTCFILGIINGVTGESSTWTRQSF